MVFFALCKVCGSKRLIIESLEPKKVCLFLKQKLMCCRMMMMHKWFLSCWCFHKILCFKGLLPSPVGSCSSEVHLGPPGAVQRLCEWAVNAASWEEMSPRSQNAWQTHFPETRALSQDQFLWEMEYQHESYQVSYPAVLSILLSDLESICGQWALGRAIINSLSKWELPSALIVCQKHSCPGRLGPIMA